jgi:hypothetical protein
MTILVGNQRGGAKDLALHLMKDENEHVEVHEIRGFVSDSVMGALNEAYALSKATQCKQFIYSLSANPPLNQRVTTDDFINVIDRSEERLGLTGQPRVIVFHEKQGRRHAHCVWSRIKADTLTAVNLSHDRKKLVALTREIFIERQWPIPEGLVRSSKRNPTNFTLAQWQQAKRQGKDPRAIKTALQDAWAVSDSKAAFVHALKERGYRLARGDRRGFLVVDHRLEYYSLSKWSGHSPTVLKFRLGDPKDLPSLEQAQADIREDMSAMLTGLQTNIDVRAKAAATRFEVRRKALVTKQQAERKALIEAQACHRMAANKECQARFNRGLSGIWDRLRGEHARIRKQNEREAYAQMGQDRQARDTMIWRHLQERQRIEIFKMRHRERAQNVRLGLVRDRDLYLSHVGPEP